MYLAITIHYIVTIPYNSYVYIYLQVEVIEEAAEYIEQLHRAIAQRLGVFPCKYIYFIY